MSVNEYKNFKVFIEESRNFKLNIEIGNISGLFSSFYNFLLFFIWWTFVYYICLYIYY